MTHLFALFDLRTTDVIDYVALNELILFVPDGPSRICYEITIRDDNVLENDELFRVSLLSDDLPLSEFVTTFVTVRDDDRKKTAIYPLNVDATNYQC